MFRWLYLSCDHGFRNNPDIPACTSSNSGVSLQSRTEKHSVNIISDSLSTFQHLYSAVLYSICTLKYLNSAVSIVDSICTVLWCILQYSALCSICTLQYSAASVLWSICILQYQYCAVSVLHSTLQYLYSAVSVLYYEALDEAVRVPLQVKVWTACSDGPIRTICQCDITAVSVAMRSDALCTVGVL